MARKLDNFKFSYEPQRNLTSESPADISGSEGLIDDEDRAISTRGSADSTDDGGGSASDGECSDDDIACPSYSPSPSPTRFSTRSTTQRLCILSPSPSPDWKSPSPKCEHGIKRTHIEQTTNTPMSSPKKKWPKQEVVSTIRRGLQIEKEHIDLEIEPSGLFQYLKQVTSKEHKEDVARMVDEHHDSRAEVMRKNEVAKRERTWETRECANEQKWAQRAQDKASEIQRGVRSPGGSKKWKVSPKLTDIPCHSQRN